MHGRLKVKTSHEQKEEKRKEQQKKLAAYRMGMEKILSSRENPVLDPESFAISAQLLCVNPDIYTLWNYRKEVITKQNNKSTEDDLGQETLIKLLDKEISLTEQCLVANPKSYGSWYHRYWILLLHPKPNWEKEFNLCTQYLHHDDRNFHCWDYRRLLVNKIGITLTAEIKFSTERLNENFSNYSSWHYRSTLRNLDETCIEDELSLVQSAVFTDPADSSGWFYLRWVLSNPAVTKDKRKELLDALQELEDLEPDCKWIVLAKCWLSSSLNMINDDGDSEKLMRLDPMRKGCYKQYLAKNICNNS